MSWRIIHLMVPEKGVQFQCMVWVGFERCERNLLLELGNCFVDGHALANEPGLFSFLFVLS